ncbi:hypothetical protein CCACVL1_07234 [Corchorus capsularis]|uniref:Uncharacterized protein n=1 Tax=Corchorus capsularis TaxID=210143 RepID=A0A1R3J869_COCAP|nr:hypothetical protein CCACVL1_07235 [Corchorus capsularis]OMO91019.1 hypothetical protein CCACVL1_07234 [Corchorus capsularis]
MAAAATFLRQGFDATNISNFSFIEP